MVPEAGLSLGATEHLHRYALACDLATAEHVLDIACGEGYGSALLARKATHVIGVDVDAAIVQHASSKYKHDNLEFRKGSVTAIPAQDSSVSLVVSFETIEHIAAHEEMLAEIRRVLKPGGVLLISTPDAETNPDPDNSFHVQELNRASFLELLESKFSNVLLMQQHYLEGSFIHATIAENIKWFDGDFKSYQTRDFADKRRYNLAVCSDAELQLPAGANSFFSIKSLRESDELKHYNEVIASIRNSASYRLGHALLAPLRWMKSFQKK